MITALNCGPVKHVLFGEGVVIESKDNNRFITRFIGGDKLMLGSVLEPIEDTPTTRQLLSALPLEKAYEAAVKENARFNEKLIKAREQAANSLEASYKREREFIDGTDVRRYNPEGIKALDASAEIVAWLEHRITSIDATVKVENEPRFAANLLDANGQEFSRTMDGFSNASERRWYDGFTISLTENIPENLMREIEGMHSRQGCREQEPVTSNRRQIFCNALAWEMLRRGHKLGKKE